MIPRFTILFLCYFFSILSVSAQWFFNLSAPSSLDINADDAVRIALISHSLHGGGIDANAICADLETTIRTSTRKPVRVTLEPVDKNRTLLGWWYNPDLQANRQQLLSGKYDFVLLAESEEIIRQYPEVFFESVLNISDAFRAKGTQPRLLLLARPPSSFRDKRIPALADITYRVGDGCSVGVIPAAYGWIEALAHNRIVPESPLKMRANAFIAAQMIYNELAGEKSPSAVNETDWAVKRMVEALTLSAWDAAADARITRHYAGLFTGGMIKMIHQITKRLAIYSLNTQDEDPIRLNLEHILEVASQDYIFKTPAHWHHDGFDRNSIAMDMIYGDMRQVDLLIAEQNYTSRIASEQNKPFVAVFNWGNMNANTADENLRMLEQITLDGYDAARSRNLNYIPYPLAWARAYQKDKNLVTPCSSGRPNDWLAYMLANMLYTSVTARFQPVSDKEKPILSNTEHPFGYHKQCAQIGYETLRQLSTLNRAANTVILNTRSFRVNRETAGFASIRLAAKPNAPVTLLCAMDKPEVAALSAPILTFTPENYDIEQTIRITATTNTATTYTYFMTAAQSDDTSIDGTYDKRLFLFNPPPTPDIRLVPNRTDVSPSKGYAITLTPEPRPTDLVVVRVAQHGSVTEELYISPDHDCPHPMHLYPTAEDYARGSMQVTLTIAPYDKRHPSKVIEQTYLVSSDGFEQPSVKITHPTHDQLIAGPAFVTATVQATPAKNCAETALFMESKRLGFATGASVSAAVEKGPPPSRLSAGTYTIWATTRTTQGLVIATQPTTFVIQ